MKKILTSLSVILLVGGIVIGGTMAYFNDTETSEGNIFIAGSLDLTVDSFGATYNGEDWIGEGKAETWTARDLTDQKFFVFDDIKPGDYGTRHISIHVDDNPGWACLLVINKDDDENVLTDPEEEADDTTPDEGELSGNIEVFAWQDDNSNGAYDPDDDEIELKINGSFAVDSFFDITYSIDIADSGSETPVLVPTGPAATRNIGIAWCVGDLSVASDGTISCDGSGMDDKAQTDNFSADVALYAEQVRNNPDFKCAEVTL